MQRFGLLPVLIGGVCVIGGCSTESGESDGLGPDGIPPLTSFTGGSSGGDGSTEGDDDDGSGDGPTTADWPLPSPCQNGDGACTDKIDLLFIIDNSGTMAVEQKNLARNFPLLVRRLEELEDRNGDPVNPDVQIMVTTTDFGNPECDQHEHEDYDPSRGAPISTPCTERLGRFTGLGTNPEEVPDACQDVCPVGVAPTDPFVRFDATSNNIPDVEPADIDGDGVPDSAVAQALACIGPQGIDGCGFESPLENMMQAINPGAAWNSGETRFLRPDALLAIAVITDEADCSVQDYTIMDSDQYRETDPDTMAKTTSSALCWNAGVSCEGPDANGAYSNCVSADNGALQPTSRYTEYLIHQLRENQNKEVVMLGILGVPEVTEHSDVPPFEPIAGGVDALEYRDWRDGAYTGPGSVGDILPDEFADGVTAAHKTADFGVGPGCTGGTAATGFNGQAIPPVRIKEVCESLDIKRPDGTIDTRCCIESICDDDFSAAIDCLAGIIGEAIVIPG